MINDIKARYFSIMKNLNKCSMEKCEKMFNLKACTFNQAKRTGKVFSYCKMKIYQNYVASKLTMNSIGRKQKYKTSVSLQQKPILHPKEENKRGAKKEKATRLNLKDAPS